MNKFNVMIWDFNRDKLEYYDVLPYLKRCYERRVEHSKEKDIDLNNKYFKVPVTFDEFKEFVKDESRYQFWARCEYEMILHDWPVGKKDYKLDVHEQIMMNIDIVTRLLMEDVVK